VTAVSRRPWLLFAFVLALAVASAGLVVAPSLAYAETAGVIYVVDTKCCGIGDGVVIRVDPTTGGQTVVSSGQYFGSPDAIALAADGKLYVADSHGKVIRVDPGQPATSNQTVISSGQNFVNPFGVAMAADGKLYVVDFSCCGGKGGVIRVDPSKPADGNQTVISSGQNFVNPVAVALAADGKLYVVDLSCCGNNQGGVIRVDPGQPATSNQTVVSSGQNFVDPFDIALAADGKLYVADSACCGGLSGVIRVDPSQPVASNQTVISFGQKIVKLAGIALAVDGKLYVADLSCCGNNQGGVIRVDPATGNQTVVSSG
jgi:sugar lactone lactonase YvrE